MSGLEDMIQYHTVGRWSQLSGAVVSGLEDMIAAVWGSCLGLLDMTQYHSSGEVVAAVCGSGVGVGGYDSGPQQWGGGRSCLGQRCRA